MSGHHHHGQVGPTLPGTAGEFASVDLSGHMSVRHESMDDRVAFKKAQSGVGIRRLQYLELRLLKVVHSGLPDRRLFVHQKNHRKFMPR